MERRRSKKHALQGSTNQRWTGSKKLKSSHNSSPSPNPVRRTAFSVTPRVKSANAVIKKGEVKPPDLPQLQKVPRDINFISYRYPLPSGPISMLSDCGAEAQLNSSSPPRGLDSEFDEAKPHVAHVEDP